MYRRDKLPPGYVIPVYNSLNRPNNFLGAPTEFTMINIALFGYVGLVAHGWLIIILNVIIQGIGYYLAKSDPIFMLALIRSWRIKKYYDA